MDHVGGLCRVFTFDLEKIKCSIHTHVYTVWHDMTILTISHLQRIISPLLLLLLLSWKKSCSARSSDTIPCRGRESLALLQLFQETNGERWDRSAGWLDDSLPCPSGPVSETVSSGPFQYGPGLVVTTTHMYGRPCVDGMCY